MNPFPGESSLSCGSKQRKGVTRVHRQYSPVIVLSPMTSTELESEIAADLRVAFASVVTESDLIASASHGLRGNDREVDQ
jgi:hypothetical protein